ncbi:MAG: VOC family protein [Rubrobacter sp.]|nr:VOC family protein [Rubrobacter sp.]
MQSGGFTHVSVHAHDLEESARFYRQLFGMEEIPSPDFPFEVRWLRVGNLALHLFESTEQAPTGHHFGLDVEEFEEIYRKAEKMGVRVQEGYFSRVYELPDGAAQLYLRDPAGNMVEVNHPDAASLDRSVVGEIEKVPANSQESARATLYPDGLWPEGV